MTWQELVARLGKLGQEVGSSKSEPEEWEQLMEARLSAHKTFLDQAWEQVESSFITSWQQAGDKVAALTLLGEQLYHLHEEFFGDANAIEIAFRQGASKEYEEVGVELLRRVKLSCPWPELGEAMGEQRTH